MRKIFFSILCLMTIMLTACSVSATVTPITSASSELPVETQLAVGILKLDGTDQAVTVEQAKELVLYWQVYKELSQSDTAAQAEIDGLIAQIQETMTDDQLQEISAMNITSQDVISPMQGITVASVDSGEAAVSVPSGGDMPAGGPPADGGAPPDGALPADMSGAAPASSGGQTQSAQANTGLGGAAGVPSALVEAVIQSLQQKITA